MNVISYDMCRTFVSSLPLSKSRRRFKVYSYYSWGVPLIIVVAANLLDRLPGLDDLKHHRPEYVIERQRECGFAVSINTGRIATWAKTTHARCSD